MAAPLRDGGSLRADVAAVAGERCGFYIREDEFSSGLFSGKCQIIQNIQVFN